MECMDKLRTQKNKLADWQRNSKYHQSDGEFPVFFFFCLISLIPSCLDSAWNLKLRFIHWVQRWKVSEETLVSGLRNRSQSSLQNSEWGNCPVLCFFKFLSFYLNKRGRGREREGEERERERERTGTEPQRTVGQ